MYVITRSGLLCQVNHHRLLEKWVELKVKRANALCVAEDHIMVGGSSGIIRVFSSRTLQYISSLPGPLPSSDVAAMCYHETSSELSVIYSDHSLVTWSLASLEQPPAKLWSRCQHSSCVWSLESYPASCTTGSSLVTCGEDDTIRVWSLDQGPLHNCRLECHHQHTLQVGRSASQRPGLRCVRVSPDGRHLVTGDRAGNIRVLTTRNFATLCKIEAHDSEVMSLDFGGGTEHLYLATASRDRLVHLFDAKNNFEFLRTLEEHSSCVTAVRFLAPDTSELRLVSCGADRSIITRSVARHGESGGVRVTRTRHVVCTAVPHDLAVDTSGQVSVACQDRNVRVFSLTANKPRILKGSSSDDGNLVKIVLDRSGSYFATSCTDKSIAVFDFQSGELISSLLGHSEVVTGLTFSHDSKYLISTSGDSCVFVWKLPKKMTSWMLSKLGEPTEEAKTSQAQRQQDEGEEFGSPPDDFLIPDQALSPEAAQLRDFRFSVGKLPAWARNTRTAEADGPLSPRAKWGSQGRGAIGAPLHILERPEEEQEEEEEEKGEEDQEEEESDGTVEAKKTLFLNSNSQEECECSGTTEEFQVNATDLETLRKSQRKLTIPSLGETEEYGGEDTSMDLLTEDDKDHEEEEESLTNLRCLDSLGFLSGDENIVMKPSSISNAWRQGTTPVQKQQQQLVSIEKLLATNQLHSILRGVTPAKSPLLAKQQFTDLKTLDRSEPAEELTVLEELSQGVKNTPGDSKTGGLSKELIQVSPCFIYIDEGQLKLHCLG